MRWLWRLLVSESDRHAIKTISTSCTSCDDVVTASASPIDGSDGNTCSIRGIYCSIG